ncbi:MAG: exo-alpha-sialidase [Candidatus Cloacimonadota bacterium]|nr:MAG: exo-alpha-sialidase [Candidatus Cloacimonadota bacterium]
MRTAGMLIVFLLLLNGVLFCEVLPLQNMNFLRMSDGAECGYGQDNPPPIDSLCLVYSGIDYGANFNSPQAYPNAKHITNVRVGSYYFPVILWETGDSWSKQSLFSYWDDMFKFWSYPDSFTTNAGIDTGRPMVCVDSHGNLHFCWHQTGSPDGYETFYTRAILDTSAGVVQYTIERPAQFISQTDGTEARFPSMGIYDDTLIMVVFDLGRPVNATGYNYSTDGGSTWAGQGIAYDPGGALPGSWIQPCTAVDQNTGDTWVALCFDESGDGSMDLNILHWEASSDIWTIETAHNATSMHPYAAPSIVCDNNGIPHVIFQENLTTTGGSGGLSGWNGCGPAGTLYYTHRQGGSWSAPVKIMFPRYPVCNYASGYPSAGIAADNTIYFSITQPDSATPDTAVYLPFNVHYG